MKLEGNYLTVAVNLVLIFAQIAFGAYHVIGKEALNYINAVVFAFYREIIAGPSLVIIAIIVERAKPDFAKDWWRFILLGTTGVYLNQLLFIEGLAMTSATQAAIMQPCIPVFTTALTLILRTEKFHILKVVGILFSAAGAVVMVGVEGVSFKSEQTKGMLCLIGNTLAMSIYYIFQKPVLQKYPPISVTGWAYIIGSFEMGLTSLYHTHGRADMYGIDRHVIIPLAYSIIFATILTYMGLTWANKYAPASVVAAYASLQPLTAAILSYIFLHQTPKTNEYIGAAAIIAGLAMVTYARVREAKQQKEQDEASSPPPQDRKYHPINVQAEEGDGQGRGTGQQGGEEESVQLYKRKSYYTSDNFATDFPSAYNTNNNPPKQ